MAFWQGSPGLILSQGTKILQFAQYGSKRKPKLIFMMKAYDFISSTQRTNYPTTNYWIVLQCHLCYITNCHECRIPPAAPTMFSPPTFFISMFCHWSIGLTFCNIKLSCNLIEQIPPFCYSLGKILSYSSPLYFHFRISLLLSMRNYVGILIGRV